MNLESGPAVALAEGCVFSLLLIFALSDLWLARGSARKTIWPLFGTPSAPARVALWC